MAEEVVKFEQQGHVAIFTLNRPGAKNAVNGAVSALMEKLLDQFEANEQLWIGIIKSSLLDTFSAGADLKAINAREQITTKKGHFAGLVKYPRTKPMIACVEGNALAGGTEICLACDLLVASKGSKFGVPEVKRSLVPGAGGLFRLPRVLPRNIGMELVLTGDTLDADRAYQFGMINVLTEKGDAFKEALALAQRIEVNAPIAVSEAVQAVHNLTHSSDDDSFTASDAAMRVLSKTEDYKEGPLAFIEKRPPKWTGKRPPAKL